YLSSQDDVRGGLVARALIRVLRAWYRHPPNAVQRLGIALGEMAHELTQLAQSGGRFQANQWVSQKVGTTFLGTYCARLRRCKRGAAVRCHRGACALAARCRGDRGARPERHPAE